MTMIRDRDGVIHDIFATTSAEYMSNCGVFYKKYMVANADVVTCLRCAVRPALTYTEIEVNDHG